MSLRARLADTGWTVGITALILGPLLFGRGYTLRGDMVFVPDQPWKDAWLGLDGAVGRFVPGEAVVWALGQVLPGDLVQKLLLAAAFVAAGTGIARLASGWSVAARWSAIMLFLWNPWTYERLSIGQWPLLVGYAALPWAVHGVIRLRDGSGWAVLTFALAAAALASPPSGLLVLGVSVALVASRSRVRRTLAVLGCGIAYNLPWIVPSLLAPQQPRASAAQFAAFALQGEAGLGTLVNAFSLGEIWKTSIVPSERTEPVLVLLATAMTLVAVAGLRMVPTPQQAEFRRLTVVAGGLLVFAFLTSLESFSGGLGSLSQRMPALGLVRDSHRLLAPWAVVVAVGFAGAVEWAWRRAGPGQEAWRLVAAAGCVLPALLLPSFAWGLAGELRAVDYPDEWYDVQALPAATTVVLPWHGTYRGYDWNRDTAVLDPAPRMFPGEVLIDDRHFLGEVVLESEERLLAAVAEALDAQPDQAGERLRLLGVERVVVERGNGVEQARVPAGTTVYQGRWLQVVDLGDSAGFRRPAPSRISVLAADALALLTFLTAMGFYALPRRRFGYGARSLRAENRESK